MSRIDYALFAVALLCVLGLILPYDARLTLLGVLFGGVITAGFSWYFYQRASQELKDEAAALRAETARLKHHTTLILRGLEEAGLVELNWDGETGEIRGMVVKISGVASGVGSASGTLTEADDADIDAPADQD